MDLLNIFWMIMNLSSLFMNTSGTILKRNDNFKKNACLSVWSWITYKCERCIIKFPAPETWTFLHQMYFQHDKLNKREPTISSQFTLPPVKNKHSVRFLISQTRQQFIAVNSVIKICLFLNIFLASTSLLIANVKANEPQKNYSLRRKITRVFSSQSKTDNLKRTVAYRRRHVWSVWCME